MARQPIQTEYTSWIRGLITEASPFTYPENASLEERNFVLNRDGSRQRRFGIDYEDAYELIDTGVDVTDPKVAIAAFTWSAVANNGDSEFAVIQVGNTLRFFNSKLGSISQNPVNGGTAITIPGNATEVMEMDSLYGKLFVVHGTQYVYILSYDSASDTITVEDESLSIRDLFGVDDGLDIDERPTTLSSEHEYNLRNQGWPLEIETTTNLSSVSTTDPIDATFTANAWYPSNADIMWASKAASASAPVAVGAFYPAELKRVVFGSTRAPLGHYIIDVFNRGANRGLSGKSDTSNGGITAVAAYAGRAFYAVRETSRSQTDSASPNIGTMIFYSVAKDSIPNLVACHSEADPTAEHVFDPIDTDGGFITIPEAGQVIKLVPMGQSLFVFCSNGVWEIHGGEDSFSALNQNVTKTTNVSAASSRSIVYAEDTIAFLGATGIYRISRNDLTLRGGTNDLTIDTIQSFYDDIDGEAIKNAVGTYDPFIRTYRWLYRDGVLPNSSFYNKELIYNVSLEAFYTFSINAPTFDWPFIAGFISLDNIITTSIDEQVIVSTDEEPPVDQDVKVVDDNVIVRVADSNSTYKGSVKYLTVLKTGATHKITFSHYKNKSFRDWYTYDSNGVDADALMLSGAITGGSAMLNKAIDYLHFYMKRTELGLDVNGNVIDPSSCQVQVQWDWTDSVEAGRWSRPIEVYRLPRIFAFSENGLFDYGYTTVVTKNRIRGRGRALSFLLKTKPFHNCHIYGWGISGSAGAE